MPEALTTDQTSTDRFLAGPANCEPTNLEYSTVRRQINDDTIKVIALNESRITGECGNFRAYHPTNVEWNASIILHEAIILIKDRSLLANLENINSRLRHMLRLGDELPRTSQPFRKDSFNLILLVATIRKSVRNEFS